jgi:hypothetical protein
MFYVRKDKFWCSNIDYWLLFYYLFMMSHEIFFKNFYMNIQRVDDTKKFIPDFLYSLKSDFVCIFL